MSYIEDDEAIARAIAESEGHVTTETIVRSEPVSNSTANNNCPANHGLELFQTSPVQRVTCDKCHRSLIAGESVWSCNRCNYDCCDRCHRPVTVQGTSLPPSRNPAYSHHSPYNNPFIQTHAIPKHMCLIPCAIGDITVEMLVDTGAQSSVLSMPYVRQLGLANRLDRRTMGVAAGVGRAKICGRISNVVCAFGEGHVEFPMDFIVLDVSDPLVILGLDQLRKYKCLVDMEREKLIFGGSGGVEVQMLPEDQQHFDVRQWNNSGCILM